MTERHRALLTGAVLAAVAVALYILTLENGFAYDDVSLIAVDERVHSLRNIPALLISSYWPSTELALYRPLVSVTFAIDHAIFNGNPWGFHLTNTLLDAGVVVLMFALLLRFGSLVGATCGALLFATHPVHTEAVANIVGRAELLVAAFTLIAALLWLRRDARGTAALLALSFLGALASKESAIMLPALLALIDIARGELRPGGIAAWLRTRRTHLLALGASAAFFIVVRGAIVGWHTPLEINPAMEVAAGVERVQTALQIWPFIARLLLFPRVLLADYSPGVIMPATTWSPLVLFGAALLAALVVGGALAWRSGRGMLALLLVWVPVALFPVSNLVFPIGVLLAERTLFVPSIVVAFAIAALIDALRRRKSGRYVHAAVAAVIVIAAAGSARVVTRLPDWYDTDTLFAAQLRDAPNSYRAHWQQARAAAAQNQKDTALARYFAALRVWPYRKTLVLEAAMYAAYLQEWGNSRQLSELALKRWPDELGAHRMVAQATLKQGDTVVARTMVERALRYHPRDSVLLQLRWETIVDND